MKKKIIRLVILVMICGGFIWYYTPVNFVSLDAADVYKIMIFNGNSGEKINITDREDIEYLISNWNEVTLKRGGISSNYSGWCFKVTIYLEDGEEADGWNDFIINSDENIRKDPFFYSTTSTLLEYDYIQNLFDEIED